MGIKQKFLKLVFYVIPHHAISRVVYYVTRIKGPQNAALIAWFVKRYRVNMEEAEYPEIAHYRSFNEFFTRRLKPGLRPLTNKSNSLACPCDGTVSQLGSIDAGRILQAKQHDYSVLELLGGDTTMAAEFTAGRFATIYLAPYNYHRLHMPIDGKLIKMIHIPGRLFSVAQWTVAQIPRLFARNERLACYFETAAGPIVMVLVGAMNVAAIETVWCGLVVPPRGKKISSISYHDENIHLSKGAEMGRFNMGSTLILLTGANINWLEQIEAEQTVNMGQLFGYYADAAAG